MSPPAAERTCRSCHVRVHFLPGHEPDWRNWRDGICLACRQREISHRCFELAGKEQTAYLVDVVAELPESKRYPSDLSAIAGVSRGKATQVISRAVREGRIPRPPRRPSPVAPKTAKPRRRKAPRQRRLLTPEERSARQRRAHGPRRERRVQGDLQALRGHPDATISDFAQARGISVGAARTRLFDLVRSGQVAQRRAPERRSSLSGGAPLAYRVAGT